MLNSETPVTQTPTSTPPACQILRGHESFETAYIQNNYPFGYKLRCLRKCWIERGTTGMNRSKFRMCTCTTKKAWNAEYTKQLNAGKLDDIWIRIPENPSGWNAPKKGTYHSTLFMYRDTLESQDDYIKCNTLPSYQEPYVFYRFYDDFYTQLTDQEKKIFRGAVLINYRLPEEDARWQAWEKHNGRTDLRNL